MDKFKIISFNTCVLPPGLNNAGAKNDFKKQRMNLFFEHIAPQYDILLLQEVWDVIWATKCNSPLHIVLKLGFKAGFSYFAYMPRKCYQICNNGLVILSKHPMKSWSAHTFKHSAGLQYWVPNGVLHANIEIESRSMDVFVTHIHAGPLDSSLCNSVRISKNVQKKQIKELKHFVEQNSTGHYIVAGDFNVDALNSSETLLDYDTLLNIMGQHSIIQTLNFPNTYPVPVQGSFLVNPLFIDTESCVDHAFTNLEFIKVAVMELVADNIHLSDHAAIHMELEISSLTAI
jgi:endonuclease/exonuclease/phosphatase family metal-dependent hydrolase